MLLIRTLSLLFIRTLSLCYSTEPCPVSLLFSEHCLVSLVLQELCLFSLLLPEPCFVSSPGYSPELCPVSLLLSRTSSCPSATPRTLFCLVSLLLSGPCLVCATPRTLFCLVSLLLPGPCLVFSLLLKNFVLFCLSATLHNLASSLCYSQILVLSCLSATPRTLSCLSATPRTLSCLSATPRTLPCPRERETELQNFSHLESGEDGKWSISTAPEPRPQNWITSCVLLIQLPSPAMYC